MKVDNNPEAIRVDRDTVDSCESRQVLVDGLRHYKLGKIT